ncbi:HNH_endonuclease [Hexamita inflata]|uniref:HNH endonuclease n=1 Tax=Hexamita inflata TaxID=28002 RepID=A0AA86QBP2_9EUKA|nr:HNH endonuclease [Hexamita inflata]
MQFKQIEDFPNYLVFENGTIVNINNGNIVKASLSNTGYLICWLVNENTNKCCQVHQLVANAFIGVQGKFQVDHCDRNRLNNHYKNLRYVTSAQNHRNRTIYGGHEAIYVNKIPSCCVLLTEYGNHILKNYCINPITYEMYYFNDFQFRQLNLLTTTAGKPYYYARDINNKGVTMHLSVLKQSIKIDQVE